MIAGRTFVITGTFSQPREEIKRMVYANGGTVTGLVNPSVDVVIMGEDTGSRAAKAQDLGIEIWTEEQFNENVAAVSVGNDAPDLSKVPSTREEAMAYIELLCRQFDIVHDEDMYSAAIESMTAMYEERTAEIVKQAMGVAMKASGRKYLVVDPSVLSDSKPYDVITTDMPNGTCRYQLRGLK